MGALLMDLAHN